MKNSHLGLGLLLVVAVSGACFAGCGEDDPVPPPGAGGSGGSPGSGGGGAGGTAGKGGSSGGQGGSTGGNAGSGGGVVDSGKDADACSKPGVKHTKPTVAASIDAPAGTTLVGGYYAEGDQIYTCVAAADAGPSAEGGDAAPAPSGTWVNTAEAALFGDNCSSAGTHSYTGASPTWKATDNSTVLAARVAVVPAPVADGGDSGAATAIAWALLKATSNTGEGIFGNVTYIQRTDTTGGLGPSGACDPAAPDGGALRRSPYTAIYYFYTGGSGEGGSSEGGEASTPVDSGTTDTGTTPEAGGD